MESAFAWIGEFVSWFAQFFPRWVILDTRMGAVKWTTFRFRDLFIWHGWRWSVSLEAKAHALRSGFHVYWPLFSEFEIYPVVRQTLPLASQDITTTDNHTVTVSGVMVYEIFDLLKIQAETYDPDDTIRDIAASTLLDVCCKKAWDELRGGQGKTLDTALKNAAKKELEDYGVHVKKFSLRCMAKSRVLRLVQSTSQEGELK